MKPNCPDWRLIRPKSLLKTGIALAVVQAAAAYSDRATAQQDATDEGVVEQLTITAQRRAQNIQKVPLAVSAFSSEQLSARVATETLDLVRYVPNLVGHNNTGLGTANTYFIRGLGNTESIATFDPPVGSYVDDVYISRQNANNYAFFDVERVEVLRGPQGTLFGRNTTGGAINVITRKPSEEMSAYGEAGYGRFDRILIRGGFDLPASEKFLTKFAAFYVQDDGFVDNLTTGETLDDEESWGIRGAVRVLPTDRITWDLSGEVLSSNGTNIGDTTGMPFTSFTGISKEPGTGAGPTDFPLLNDLLNGLGLGNDTNSYSIVSNIEFEFSTLSVSLITGYRNLNQKFILDFVNAPVPTGGFSVANDGDHEQFSQEIKLNGTLFEERVEYVAGFFYLDETNETRFADVVPGLVLADRLLGNDTESFALYAQADVNVTDDLIFTAGLRWTDETKDVEIETMPNGLASLSTADLTAAGVPTRLEESEINPRFALQYSFNDDVNVFASATNGFKSGGWNARATSATAFQPFFKEEAWSYEFGLRSQWSDGRFTFNATGFYMDVSDLQVVTGFADAMGTVVFATQNAADLRVFGLEIEARAVPNDYLDIFATIGLMDAEYQNIRPDLVGLSGDLDPVRTPNFTASFGGQFTYPISNWGANFVANGTLSFTGEHFVATNNAPAGLSEERVILTAGIGIEDDEGVWGLYGECKNCANEEYLEAFFVLPYLGDPATWQIRAVLRYN